MGGEHVDEPGAVDEFEVRLALGGLDGAAAGGDAAIVRRSTAGSRLERDELAAPRSIVWAMMPRGDERIVRVAALGARSTGVVSLV